MVLSSPAGAGDAGRDTSARSVHFTVYQLGPHLQIMRAFQTPCGEIQVITGDACPGRKVLRRAPRLKLTKNHTRAFALHVIPGKTSNQSISSNSISSCSPSCKPAHHCTVSAIFPLFGDQIPVIDLWVNKKIVNIVKFLPFFATRKTLSSIIYLKNAWMLQQQPTDCSK